MPIGYSYNIGGFALQELGEMINFAATGNLDLINLLVDSLKKSEVKVATGNMFTSDSIHSHDEKFLQNGDL
ncbi:hypothetical protein [Sulfuracidifex metallicus]|uniref:hypothetical protein n=1 Tax=Sulfuracidifex metallicus TaxID=47303 RepID=UPI0006D1C796|nr:hypothetical protein [Sulfuracidifex metallicus]